MRCPRCAAEVRDTANVCGYCGARLAREEPPAESDPGSARESERRAGATPESDAAGEPVRDSIERPVLHEDPVGGDAPDPEATNPSELLSLSPHSWIAIVLGILLMVSTRLEWTGVWDDAFELDFIGMFQGGGDFHEPFSTGPSLGHVVFAIGLVVVVLAATIDTWRPWALGMGVVVVGSSVMTMVWLWLENQRGFPMVDLEGASGLAPGVVLAFAAGIGLIVLSRVGRSAA